MQTVLVLMSIAIILLFVMVVLQFVYNQKHFAVKSETFTTPTTDIGVFAHPGNTKDDVLRKMLYRQV